MTPDELMDDEAARNAEAAAARLSERRSMASGLISPSSDESPFTSAGSTIPNDNAIAAAAPSDVAAQQRRQKAQRDALNAGLQSFAKSPAGQAMEAGGEYLQKAGGNLLGLAGAGFDAVRSIPPYALTKLERFAGGEASPGTFTDEKRLLGQMAAPVWESASQAADLWNEATSQNAPPRAPDVRIPHEDTNAGEQLRRAGENFGVAFDSSAPWQDRVVSGLAGTVRGAAVMGNPFGGMKEIAGEMLPGLNRTMGLARSFGGPTVGEAAGAVGKSLADAFPASRGINFPSGGAPVRRGVFNLLPGEESPANNAMKRVLDMAHKVIDPKGWAKKDLMKLSDESRDAVFALADPVIQETGGVEKYAAMDDFHLEQALRNSLREGEQAERPWRTMRSLDAPTGAAEEGGSIGTMISEPKSLEGLGPKTDQVRAERGLTPEQRQANADLVVEAINAADSPAGVQGVIDKFNKTLKTQQQDRILRDLGMSPARDKAKNTAQLQEYLSRNFETPPPPTTPEGLQAANEMEVARQAEEAAGKTNVSPQSQQNDLLPAGGETVAKQNVSPPPQKDVRVLEPEEPPMMTDEGPASLPPPRSAGAEGVSPTEGVPNGQVENRYGETAEIPGEENWAHQTPRQNGVVPSGHQGSGSEAVQGQRAEVLKRGPIRTSTPTEGAWQGVRRPENPMTPEGPIEPNPPRRAPIQGPKSEPKSAPERYDTGAALNHVDTLENAASRAGNAAGRKLAEDLRETISYGESNAARPLAEWNDGVKAVADNPKALAEIADVGGGEGLVTPAAWKRAGAGNWRVGRFQANVDGNAAKMGIRPEEVALTQPESQALVENYWRRRAETGKEAELLGVKTANGRPFKAMVKRFVQRPDSAAKKWMVDGNPEFEDFLKEAHAIYPFAEPNAMRSGLKSWAAGSLDRPAAFEFERAFPMLPAARVSRRTGELMPLLVDAVVPTAINTEGAGAQLIRSEWMRLGGIKHMGQDVTLAMADDPANVAGLLNNLPLGKALAADPATLDAAKGAIGAVYGRAEAGVLGGTPVAETSLATSRSPWIQLLRTTVSKGVGLLNLGLQGLKSVPQTLGEVPAMTGAANFAKAVAAVAMKHGMTSDEARLAGALHEKFLMEGSKVFDRHRLTESILSQNINRFPTERLNDFVKDLNDTIAFTAGKFKGEEMLAKGSKTSDHLMMDEMNLPQSTQDVFRNPANYTEAEQAKAVEDFGRRVAQETQFHAKNRALKGRFENDQWLRYVLPYLQYSINTAKRTYRDFERVWRMSGKGIDEDANMFSQFMQRMNPFGDSREQFRTAVKRLVYRTTGMELSGEMIADLSAEFQGKDPLRRDRSVLARFLENLKYASFLGPFQVIADQLSAHVLKGLGNDSKETIKSFADSKPIELQNPAAEAAIKTGMKALKGDFGGAAYEATVRQSPLATGVGRATGIMDPAGSRHANGKTKTPSAGKGFFDDLGGGGKKGMFDELKGGRKGGGMFDELGKGKSKKGFFD